MDGLILVTGPSGDVVTLAEAKTHLRVTHSNDDTYITALLSSVITNIESESNLKILTQTWKQVLDDFPCGNQVKFMLDPVSSVTSVTYVDENGDTQTMSVSDYQFVSWRRPQRLYRGEDLSDWPTTKVGRMGSVQITFVVGYANAAAVPEPIKQAIKVELADMYWKRLPAEKKPLLTSSERLIQPYRLW